MTEIPSPGEFAAARISAGGVQQRLDADISVVRDQERRGARVDTEMDSVSLVDQLREQAASIDFDSPIEAAAMSLQRSGEIPLSVRRGESRIADLYTAVSLVVAEGVAVADRPAYDGGRTVVLHHMIGEPAGVRSTLEAVVRVRGGSAWLQSFGWPRNTVHGPIHAFSGSTADHLGQAEADLRSGALSFDRAMLMLVGAAASADSEQLSDTSRAVGIAEHLAANRGLLDAYVTDACDYSLNRESGWYGACLYRSALETAFEHFLGSSAFSLIDIEEISDIDGQLDDTLAEDRERIPFAAAPTGIPRHHWWWNPEGRR
ncbi:hypothetical protein [Streptomonospora wellingtoniae]|uniref:Uncharacterized protein n=1 Tax=Streptomonospora wellingtoniae TaxID=3075544 RepID=A0ABU2KTY2_9ACTN|nr:hypothetical protein [Streptomonospora sp. DSM 45055]MDT0302751.1 hypothetical protein [Streptomonospora sp. DSM 45055]